ncbi:MAG: glycosyltransferase family 4 protein [Deltaproteobacteria bacterium]|nr:glycosyltransferase family 4 protein [Deltaproteobacteria bacterium]
MHQERRAYTILHTEASLGWGGQEHRILAEARAMRARGHRLLIAADRRSALLWRARAAGFPAFALRFGGRRNISAWRELRRLLRAEGVDILNTHSSLDSWVGNLAWASLGNRPVLVRTRHLSTPVKGNRPTRWLYQAPAAVLTTSREIARHLEERAGVPASRLFPIPTGVDLAAFSPRAGDPALRAGLQLPEGAFMLGTVSVLRSWKGHLYVLEALRELLDAGRNVALVIVGDGPYRPVIEARRDELGLGERVRLVGHQEQVPDWLALMDAFVMASYAHEGVPQALLQALALARPVAATRLGGIPEVVTDGETGLLVPPKDAPDLARALGRLLDHPEEGRAMGERGRELVAARFSLEAMAAQVEAVYDQIMGGS